MKAEKREEIALFWYGLLVPLLDRDLSLREKREKIIKITSRTYLCPDGQQKQFSPRTIKRKLKLYEAEGFGALKPRERKDRGKSRVLSENLIARAIELKAAQPKRSLRVIVRMLEADPNFKGTVIKTKTLYRIFQQRGVTRKELGENSQKVFISFRKKKINQLWQSDITQGIYLPDPDREGRKKLTHLFAFIDDHSRLVPHGEFYFDEKLPRLENCFKKGLLKRGIPEAIYTDWGRVFCSRQFKLICAELEVKIYHCEPYHPEGKGKIERFFGFVQSDFIPEARARGVKTLDELNQYFFAWLEISYHHKIHSSLGRTPACVFAEQQELIRPVDPLKLKEIFLWREERLVSKHATISIYTNLYEIAPELIVQTVEARFDPFDLSLVYIFSEGKLLLKAFPVDLKKKRYPKLPPRHTPAKPTVEISYLDILLDKYQKLIEKNMEKFSFKKLKQAEADNQRELEEFLQLVEKEFGRKLKVVEKGSLEHFFKQYGSACLTAFSGMDLSTLSTSITAFSKFLEKFRRKIIRQKQKKEG